MGTETKKETVDLRALYGLVKARRMWNVAMDKRHEVERTNLLESLRNIGENMINVHGFVSLPSWQSLCASHLPKCELYFAEVVGSTALTMRKRYESPTSPYVPHARCFKILIVNHESGLNHFADIIFNCKVTGRIHPWLTHRDLAEKVRSVRHRETDGPEGTDQVLRQSDTALD